MIFQKSQPVETGQEFLSLDGPTKKRTPKFTKKLAAFRSLANCHGFTA
jgi:hypothetical protein